MCYRFRPKPANRHLLSVYDIFFVIEKLPESRKMFQNHHRPENVRENVQNGIRLIMATGIQRKTQNCKTNIHALLCLESEIKTQQPVFVRIYQTITRQNLIFVLLKRNVIKVYISCNLGTNSSIQTFQTCHVPFEIIPMIRDSTLNARFHQRFNHN